MPQWPQRTNKRHRPPEFLLAVLEDLRTLLAIAHGQAVQEQDLGLRRGMKVLEVPMVQFISFFCRSSRSLGFIAIYPGLAMPANQLNLTGYPDIPDPYLVRKKEQREDG